MCYVDRVRLPAAAVLTVKRYLCSIMRRHTNVERKRVGRIFLSSFSDRWTQVDRGTKVACRSLVVAAPSDVRVTWNRQVIDVRRRVITAEWSRDRQVRQVGISLARAVYTSLSRAAKYAHHNRRPSCTCQCRVLLSFRHA